MARRPDILSDRDNWGEVLNEYLGVSLNEDGTIREEAVAGLGVETTVTDAVGEWWIHPLATYQDRPYPRTVFGAIASDGTILACEFNHGTGKTKRYAVGSAFNDDHNTPALWARDGRRPVIVWTQHGLDTYLHLKVGSRSGALSSLAAAAEIKIDQGSGVTTAYTQVFRIGHLSSEAEDVLWVFFRGPSDHWRIQPLTVDHDTGAITPGTVIDLLNEGASYLSVADAHVDSGNQTLRCAWGFNPAVTLTAIRYFEIDCVTGAVTSPVDDTLAANLDGTNLPLTNSVAAFVPDVASPTTESRRLFYVRPGPDSPAVAYAEWAEATPDAATYKVAEWRDALIAGVPTTDGYFSAAHNAAYDDAQGFDYRIALKTPSAQPAGFEVGSRLSGTDGWYLRIRPSTQEAQVYLSTSAGVINHYIAGPSDPFAWGDIVGFRLMVDVAGGILRRYYSPNPLDPNPIWEELGSGAGVAVSGTVQYGSPVALRLPAFSSAHRTDCEVYWAELRDSAGVMVASMDFRSEWVPGETSAVDAEGNTWSTSGTASVADVGNLATYRTFGTAGPRVGYTAGANYIAGMAFESPSYDGAVIQARSDGTTDAVERLVPAGASYTTEVLHSQPTAEGRLVRPYAPMNGGPFRAIVTDMQSYSPDSYYTFDGNVRGLS